MSIGIVVATGTKGQTMIYEMRTYDMKPGLMRQAIQRFGIPLGAGNFGNQLLREHVERSRRNTEPVELATVHRIE